MYTYTHKKKKKNAGSLLNDDTGMRGGEDVFPTTTGRSMWIFSGIENIRILSYRYRPCT